MARITPKRAALSCAAAALLAVATAGAASGPFQQPVIIKAARPAAKALPAPAGKILAALNDPSYAARRAMTRSLLADPKLTDRAIKWLIGQARTPEQLNRLLTIARHITLRTAAHSMFRQIGAGSLGLTHRSVQAGAYPWLHHGAVEVLMTIPGFPAYAYLQAGDIITGLGGKPFGKTMTATRFKQIIEQHHCGDKISLTLHRAGKTQTVSFRLASSTALSAMYAYQNGRLKLHGPFQNHWLAVRKALLNHAPILATTLAPPKATPAAK